MFVNVCVGSFSTGQEQCELLLKQTCLQRYGLRLVAISKMYCPSNRKTSAVSLSRCFCTIGIVISKTHPCPAVVRLKATICSSSSGVKAAFGCPRLSYGSTWPSMKQVVTDEYEHHYLYMLSLSWKWAKNARQARYYSLTITGYGQCALAAHAILQQ